MKAAIIRSGNIGTDLIMKVDVALNMLKARYTAA